MPKQAIIQVVAAVITNEKGQILITRRLPHSHLAGLWEFPGGKIDSGESPEQALKRELKEELNVDVKVKQLLWQQSFNYSDRHINILFFECQLLTNPEHIKALEVADFKWIFLDQFDAFDFPPADRQFIEQLKKKKVVVKS